MALSTRQRWIVLGGVLALTVAASVWLESEETDRADVVGAAKPETPATSQKPRESAAQETLALEALKRQPREGKPDDAFAAKSWYVPPPPPKAAMAPPPPLPFTYMGRMVEDGKTMVFLTRQDRSYAARVGDTLDGTYRVDGIDAAGVRLTYLPLNMQQTLAIGGYR